MEMFQLVDRDGTPTGQATRGGVPRKPAADSPRRAPARVRRRRSGCTCRSAVADKDTNPGLWDTSVGGHVARGESTADARWCGRRGRS